MLLSTIGIICFLPCSWLLKIILITASLGYGIFILYQYGLLKSPSSIVGLTPDENGWLLHTNSKTRLVQLSGDSTVTNYVFILRFSVPGKRLKHSCLVFRDSFECKDSYRKLRLQF